jgi:hypothetical protein
VLDFCVTDRATIQGRDPVFLSRNPQEHHQIALVPGPEGGAASTINRIRLKKEPWASALTNRLLEQVYDGLVD